MKKEKIIIPAHKRRPDKKVGLTIICQEISKETGFKADDIRIVIVTLIKTITNHLLNETSVSLPRLGMFYPIIRAPRIGMCLKGGIKKPVKMTLPPRWITRFQEAVFIKSSLSNKKITKQEIDNLYES